MKCGLFRHWNRICLIRTCLMLTIEGCIPGVGALYSNYSHYCTFLAYWTRFCWSCLHSPVYNPLHIRIYNLVNPFLSVQLKLIKLIAISI
ncbi:hypothetical protein F4680DRAFT_413852 [Xylaria scruposa]|nr:hypothetical protein F4680DRAFT_413852 [Xylaria scruposa]